jgi:hypothetical protein
VPWPRATVPSHTVVAVCCTCLAMGPPFGFYG